MSDAKGGELFAEIGLKFKASGDFVANCEKLREGHQKLSRYAHEYDYSPSVPGNGYRSFVKIIERFAARVAFQPLDGEVDPDLVTMSEVFVVVLDFLEIVRKINAENEESSDGYVNVFCRNEALIRDIFETSLTLEPELKAFYGTHSNFWHCKSMRRSLKLYIRLLVFYSSPLLNSPRVVWDIDYVSEVFADFAQNVSVSFIKKFWSLSEMWFYKHFLPNFMYTFGPKIAKTVFVPMQADWVISSNGKLFAEFSGISDVKKQAIRCRYLQEGHFGESPKNSLILHIHGAGFIAQTPESHENYLRDWVIKMKGVPLLSVDYSLSPEHKYPKALQEVLDVYLFLVSGEHEVVEIIGFHPQNIVICGDSAGAVLALCLTLVLNDIRALGTSTPRMPSAVVAIYPCVNFTYSPSASKIMSTFDTFLPTGVVLSVADAYISEERTNPHVTWKRSTNSGPRHDDEKPWYRQSDVHKKLATLNERAKDPYISPVFYAHFDSLRDVALYVIAAEFCPLLDDSVILAKTWKGPVSFDIMPDLPHGFLYFLAISENAKQATNTCFERLLQSLKLTEPTKL